MKDVLISICSGLIGALLTIGYQHFFSQPQSFTFIYNDKEMIVTESDYTELMEQNIALQNENHTYISDLEDANKRIAELQTKNNNEFEQLKQQYDQEINSKYDVDFQTINLVLNGIDSKYSDKVAIINNETFYSLGFLQYLTDSQKVSSDTSRLFIGDIQSEETMPVSLFNLNPTFTEGYLVRTTDEEDNYGNKYDEAFKVITSTHEYDDLRGITEYLVEKEYSTFSFDVVHSKNAVERLEYEIVIYGDNKQLKSITVDKKTKIQHIDIDISNVEFLQIIGKGTLKGGPDWDSYYSLIVNPYLYP